MTPPRRGWGRLEEVGRELSERDWAVLRDLARVRLLTGRHVQRMHVHDGSPLTQARRTRALLQRLHDHELVARMERQVGGVQAGSSGFVYALAARGQRLVSNKGPAGGGRLRRPWEPSRLFVDHLLAVSELYVALREAEGTKELELLDFQAEPACWRWWLGPGGERLVLKPDAFVAVGVGDYEHRTFVEVDLATESRTVIRRKAETYVAYWQSGVEDERFGVFPRVLFAVPDVRRQEQVVGVLAQLDPEAWQLFRVVLTDEAIWVLSGRHAPENSSINT